MREVGANKACFFFFFSFLVTRANIALPLEISKETEKGVHSQGDETHQPTQPGGSLAPFPESGLGFRGTPRLLGLRRPRLS